MAFRYVTLEVDIPKKTMLIFLSSIAAIIAKEYGLKTPSEVSDIHVEEVYRYLWGTNELKFATETYFDKGVIKKYLQEAVDKLI